MVAPNGWSSRLRRTLRPTLAGFSVAPITATVLGLKKGDRGACDNACSSTRDDAEAHSKWLEGREIKISIALHGQLCKRLRLQHRHGSPFYADEFFAFKLVHDTAYGLTRGTGHPRNLFLGQRH